MTANQIAVSSIVGVLMGICQVASGQGAATPNVAPKALRLETDRDMRIGRNPALVPTSQKEGQEWHYTLGKPASGWEKPGFDDSMWLAGAGGFGKASTADAVVRTKWQTNEIWIRRTVNLNVIPTGEIVLNMNVTGEFEVYFDGILARKGRGITPGYQRFYVSDDAWMAAAEGSNSPNPPRKTHTLAIHCKQLPEGQFIDLGIDLAPYRK